MAYRRKTTMRRRPRRTRVRRRTRRSLRTLKVYHFKRTVQLASITGGLAQQFGALTFQLDDLPNYTEFTNLFDDYRINAVSLKFIPNRNSSDFAGGVAPPGISNFYTVFDYNDATVPGAVNDLMQYPNLKITQSSRMLTRTLRPASLDVVSAGGTTASVNPKWKQWLSTASPDVNHYGLKYCLDAFSAANAVTYQVYATFYISCKSVK